MGKPTGFLEYERVEAKAVAPKERIKNFNEFHTPLSEAEQRCQSARCMDCGVPFCQSGMTIKGMTSGCPLNNLIPEWNDLVYTGNWGIVIFPLIRIAILCHEFSCKCIYFAYSFFITINCMSYCILVHNNPRFCTRFFAYILCVFYVN